ncbi:MAG TPA: tyrosine-protein phosphatase [Roseiflexaceae bacterium]|jgi:protein-tyrosine phosphatase|nr:tyrosine-protein phosphatase [Roseiflexaceae bacterium]
MTLFKAGQRHIRLAGTHNLRDVGGYPTVEGRQTRWGALLRSDSLQALLTESQQALVTAGLQTVIDLRSEEEITRWPNVFAASEDVRYYNLPLTSSPGMYEGTTPPTLFDLYRDYLDHHHDELRAIFEAIAAPEAAPVLVHCFIGKDRTGLVTALALSAVGVPDEIIADDYALSYDLLLARYEEIRADIIANGDRLDRFDPYVYSHRETMLETLAHLHEQHGSAAEYLQAAGLPDEALERLRATLVE